MGSVRIIHPFHPQYNQEFQVLKIRNCSGKLTLSLQGTDSGSFSIQADWTDYFPSEPPLLSGPDEYISLQALLALCDMVKKTDQ
ncbi:DUF5372 family protein [Pleomorphovibrio marinus]|uniref:DUF5372 family protein n=1 Tax=Pleomorphovibrio marinus TaxID=2164132 RepID=UPI0013004B37